VNFNAVLVRFFALKYMLKGALSPLAAEIDGSTEFSSVGMRCAAGVGFVRSGGALPGSRWRAVGPRSLRSFGARPCAVGTSPAALIRRPPVRCGTSPAALIRRPTGACWALARCAYSAAHRGVLGPRALRLFRQRAQLRELQRRLLQTPATAALLIRCYSSDCFRFAATSN
jgi:hypothetical protein